MHKTRRSRYGAGNDIFGAALEGTLAARGRSGWRHRLIATTALGPVLLMAPVAAWANPAGGVLVGGDAAIHHAPGVTTIDQASRRALINWKEFNIAPGELTQFKQPGTDAIALNRVVGNDGSQIMGALKANGQVWLINPNGILFGPNARIDVHGILATTTDIADRDFMAGRYDFNRPSPNPAASVVNQGAISIGETGLGALVAPHVRNDGVIAGKLSQVVLAGAETFTLDFYGDGLVQFAATSEVKEALEEQGALVSNDGTISADGGTVLITAAAASDVVDEVINVSGVVEAKSVAMKDGAIVLDGGDSGIVHVAGALDASGPGAGEKGGAVKVLGKKVAVADGARMDVWGDAGGGEVLIGGNYKGKGAERNAEHTVVFKEARVKADALRDGDGGRVIVWSDDATRFEGTISARGGAEGGDGGFVETSSGGKLEITSTPDASAPNGNGGTWLIDPTDITIVEGDSGAIGTNTVGNTLINNALNQGVSVTLDTRTATGGGEFELGTITQNNGAPIVKISGGNAALTFNAENNIVLNDGIISSSGQINLTITSDVDNNGSGAIDANGQVNTNGGSLSLTGINNQVNFNSGIGITIDGSIQSGGGNIFISGTSTTTLASNPADGFDRGLNIGGTPGSPGVTIESQGGDIVLSGENVSITDAIILFNGSSISSGGGNIVTAHRVGIFGLRGRGGCE